MPVNTVRDLLIALQRVESWAKYLAKAPSQQERIIALGALSTYANRVSTLALVEAEETERGLPMEVDETQEGDDADESDVA